MKWTLRQNITLASLLIICTLLAIDVLHNNDILQAKALSSFAPTNTGIPIISPTAVTNHTNNGLSTQNAILVFPTLDVVPTLVPQKEASFDPADYGLPPEIGGYEIRVAVSWETRLCNPSTDLELYIYAIPNQPQTLTTTDVEQLKEITHRAIHLGFVSWPIAISEVESQSDQFNVISCFKFGGPILSATPNPDDPISMTSYDPAFWGLPKTIAGYKVLVIKSAESSKCVPNTVVQVVCKYHSRKLIGSPSPLMTQS